MKRMPLSLLFAVTLRLLISTIAAATDHGPGLSGEEAAAVTREVQTFMGEVAHDVTAQGPHAWRKYLSHGQAFFMAANGKLVFESGEAAWQGVGTLEQTIERIELVWGKDMHIDPLTQRLAEVGVPFHETLVDKSGHSVSTDGYFTGLAEHGDTGWQFRNAHWSVPQTPTPP